MSDRLVSIWTHPRATIREIVEDNPSQYVIPIAVILGVAGALASESVTGLRDFGVSVATGAVLGVIALYVVSALFYFIGNLLGGYATFQEIRTVYAWSSIPNICTFPTVFLASLVDDQSPLVYCLGGFWLVLSFWGFVIWIVGLSEVSNFSIWKVLLSTIIGWLTMAALFGCILFLVINTVAR